MNINEILQAITTVGFPVVMCGAMAWYVKYITDKNREQMAMLNSQHREELFEITEAINNNTLAMQKLIDRVS